MCLVPCHRSSPISIARIANLIPGHEERRQNLHRYFWLRPHAGSGQGARWAAKIEFCTSAGWRVNATECLPCIGCMSKQN